MAEVTTIARTEAISASGVRFKMVTQLPQTPEAYYGGSYTLKDNEWRGGEIVYHNGSGTGANKLYVQTATSGRTPVWETLDTGFVAA